MLAVFIVTAVILAGLYALLSVAYKKADRSVYELSTGPSKGLLLFAHVLYLGGALAIALEIPFAYLRYDQTDLWCAYAAFLLFATLGFLLLYTLYFTFEAVQGDEVYVRRLFRRKRYKIRDIRRIKNVVKFGIGFFDKNDRPLFYVAPIPKGRGI